jgi:hypothetical protein
VCWPSLLRHDLVSDLLYENGQSQTSGHTNFNSRSLEVKDFRFMPSVCPGVAAHSPNQWKLATTACKQQQCSDEMLCGNAKVLSFVSPHTHQQWIEQNLLLNDSMLSKMQKCMISAGFAR